MRPITLTAAALALQAIAEIDSLLTNNNRTRNDCVRAQALADAINTGEALCAE